MQGGLGGVAEATAGQGTPGGAGGTGACGPYSCEPGREGGPGGKGGSAESRGGIGGPCVFVYLCVGGVGGDAISQVEGGVIGGRGGDGGGCPQLYLVAVGVTVGRCSDGGPGGEGGLGGEIEAAGGMGGSSLAIGPFPGAVVMTIAGPAGASDTIGGPGGQGGPGGRGADCPPILVGPVCGAGHGGRGGKGGLGGTAPETEGSDAGYGLSLGGVTWLSATLSNGDASTTGGQGGEGGEGGEGGDCFAHQECGRGGLGGQGGDGGKAEAAHGSGEGTDTWSFYSPPFGVPSYVSVGAKGGDAASTGGKAGDGGLGGKGGDCAPLVLLSLQVEELCLVGGTGGDGGIPGSPGATGAAIGGNGHYEISTGIVSIAGLPGSSKINIGDAGDGGDGGQGGAGFCGGPGGLPGKGGEPTAGTGQPQPGNGGFGTMTSVWPLYVHGEGIREGSEGGAAGKAGNFGDSSLEDDIPNSCSAVEPVVADSRPALNGTEAYGETSPSQSYAKESCDPGNHGQNIPCTLRNLVVDAVNATRDLACSDASIVEWQLLDARVNASCEHIEEFASCLLTMAIHQTQIQLALTVAACDLDSYSLGSTTPLLGGLTSAFRSALAQPGTIPDSSSDEAYAIMCVDDASPVRLGCDEDTTVFGSLYGASGPTSASTRVVVGALLRALGLVDVQENANSVLYFEILRAIDVA